MTPVHQETLLKSGQQTPIKSGQQTPLKSGQQTPLKSGQQTPNGCKLIRTLSHKDNSSKQKDNNTKHKDNNSKQNSSHNNTKQNGGVRRTRSLKRQRHAVTALKRFFNELDVTRMLLIVVLAFFLCWTTFMISSILYAFNLAPAEYKLMTFGIYIACLNSIINPLIYALMNRNFRHYFKELYRRKEEGCGCVPV